MASTKLMETKDGRRYFKISVSRGYGKTPYTMRWHWPDGWSKRAAERELAKQAAAFELKCSNGEVLNRAQMKQKEAEERLEAYKLKTVRQYAAGVFMPAKTAVCSDLNGLFKMAYMDDTVSRNPMDKVQRPKPRKEEVNLEEAPKAYTAEQLRYILQCLENEPLKWRAYINLMADTGARRGECCGLQWSDIDWTAGTITIWRNAQYTPAAGVYLTTPKNKKARSVDVGPETVDLLRQLRKEQSETCISRFVFTQDDSPEVMHPDSPTRYFKKVGEKYDIEHFHPHKLRHTSASVAITNGANVVSVGERLGHSDTAVTLRMYAHANEESIRRARQAVRDAVKASES